MYLCDLGLGLDFGLGDWFGFEVVLRRFMLKSFKEDVFVVIYVCIVKKRGDKERERGL